jgi:hypothetical protein
MQKINPQTVGAQRKSGAWGIRFFAAADVVEASTDRRCLARMTEVWPPNFAREPAMKSGISNYVWIFEEIVGLL